MIDNDLKRLGQKIAKLRLAKNIKQSELAYEAGVSERTLQRIEAGEAAKSDGLLKVIKQLGKLEDILSSLDTAEFSPVEMVASTKAKYSTRNKTGKRRARKASPAKLTNTGASIVWPEDQT